MRRGVVIAQDSGNRTFETYLASNLARLEAKHGDPLAAFEYSAVAIRHLHDSGNSTTIRAVLANLAALFNRLGRYEVAATMSGFADIALHAVSRAGDQYRDNPPAQSSRRRNLRILSSQRRTDDHRRCGDLRVRPNRPGPHRTRTPELKRSRGSRLAHAALRAHDPGPRGGISVMRLRAAGGSALVRSSCHQARSTPKTPRIRPAKKLTALWPFLPARWPRHAAGPDQPEDDESGHRSSL